MDVADALHPLVHWMVAGGTDRARCRAGENSVRRLLAAFERLAIVTLLEIFFIHHRRLFELGAMLLQLGAYCRLHLLLQLHDLQIGLFQFAGERFIDGRQLLCLPGGFPQLGVTILHPLLVEFDVVRLLLEVGEALAETLQQLFLRGYGFVAFADDQFEMFVLHLQVRTTLLTVLQLLF